MKVPCFEMERWQSVWENQVELNISESGVEPLSARELARLGGQVGDDTALAPLLDARLGYPQTNGSAELRAAIAQLYPGAGPENVLVTCGCAEANLLVAWSELEPGDEVVFLQPNYMQVAGLARGLGATVKRWWLREELGWAPDLDELDRLVGPKTRLIAVCNPNNPTGAVLSEEAMKRVCAVAERVGATILADEVYRGAEFNGQLTPTFWGRSERALCTAGLSKAYGLPGLRMGWIVGPAATIEKLWGYHDYTSIAPTVLGDGLARLALEPARREKILARTRGILERNYPVVRAWVERNAKTLTHRAPAAGAIAWVGVRGNRDTAALAEELRTGEGVLVVPGEQFEMRSYLRVGFGGDRRQLEEALARVERALA